MNFKGIIKGTILSFIIVCICLFIGALLVYMSIISERTASIVAFSGAVLGCFTGALGVSKTSDGKILLNALLIGVLFSIIIIIASATVNNGFTIHTRTLSLIISVIAASFFGALFGK